MLPDEELLGQPIKLRNACIFYLGHIPTFLDIQLTKTTKSPPTHPATYSSIFERGVDPDVDNPENCHAHSQIPDEWPGMDEILEYQGRVRSRLESLYSRGIENIPRDVARAIWVGFEHEVMHLETLLYMMLQSDKTAPPTRVPVPDFDQQAREAKSSRVENTWFDVPAQDINVGMDDPESDLTTDRPFGWYVRSRYLASCVHVLMFAIPGIMRSLHAGHMCTTSRLWAARSQMKRYVLNHMVAKYCSR